MTKKLKIVLAQLNLSIGDIASNLQKHIEAAKIARDEMSADIIVFPELSLTGYPAEDLLLRPSFIADANAALQELTQEVKGIYCLVGHPYLHNHKPHNACSLIYDGKIIGEYFKHCLPNYGVFDEGRYFAAGDEACVVTIRDIPVGIIICEDVWRIDPIHQAVEKGAKLILCPNASPYELDKHQQRIAVLAKRAARSGVPIIYVNQIGGQDDFVFDGGSMVIDENGKMAQFAGFFNEVLFPVEIDIEAKPTVKIQSYELPNQMANLYQALVLSVKDYINKNNFPGVLVGLSGGIDSALTLTIAVDALGKDRVRAIMMPSRYTSDISNTDAVALINNLGVQSETISIEPTFKSFVETLKPSFENKPLDVTEENIQARCRAVILMALSNKFKYLVLTTGNRSELAVGYCTLYGDMAGAFAPLKDVPKTMVFELAKYRNQINFVIPQRTIDRPPSAELAPNQTDEASLAPYPILDKILELYLNENKSLEEIIDLGYDALLVKKIVKLIHRSEYKRRQGAIGPNIRHKSFCRDWRYPITNLYKK